ncbi:hypothetical protein [Saccharothrix syringae]|nr:hypothetical protein [Saccharothrix syringae]
MGLGERLDAIRRGASGRGVAVVVDLHGKLVDLSFSRESLTMRPEELAGVVRDLVDRAAADAVTEGVAAVGELVPADLLTPSPAPDRSRT